MTSLHSPAELDTSSHREFIEYYERESLSEATRQRFEAIRTRVVRLTRGIRRPEERLNVLDVGCGAGMQSLMWVEAGHRAYGIDINASLVEIARKRATSAQRDVRFDVGSATSLPHEDASMDVCLMPELLEHVQEWQACLNEATRVLRSGGVLYASTTNILCPIQHEFNLPLYSWYPRLVKHHFEKLAVTTRPEIANYARYPAVHWFSYYRLARYLRDRNMSCSDRFDVADIDAMQGARKAIIKLVRMSRFLRFAGQVCTPGTIIFAVKQ